MEHTLISTEHKKHFAVFRKKWYGDIFFMDCEEIRTDDTDIFLIVDNGVVGILPRKYFSFAIETKE